MRLSRLLTQIDEKYTRPNNMFFHYMKDKPIDLVEFWYYVVRWLEVHEEDWLEAFLKEKGIDLDQFEDNSEYAYDIPADLAKIIWQDIADDVSTNNPAEAPTYTHAGLSGKHPIRPDTWLVHFSDYAYAIAEDGFKYGFSDYTKLGLTTHFSDKSVFKDGWGYNFAFYADSRDAEFQASKGSYGKDCVMFRNGGVAIDHYGDQETQIVFYGPDVNPKDIILITSDGSNGWIVNVHPTKSRKYPQIYLRDNQVYADEFNKVVEWVMTNANQYRSVITGW